MTLFAVTVFAAIIAATALISHAEIVTGDCGDNGDNVKWSFDTDTGVLVISGSGDMNASREIPWQIIVIMLKPLLSVGTLQVSAVLILLKNFHIIDNFVEFLYNISIICRSSNNRT